MSTNDGGPAFPTTDLSENYSTGEITSHRTDPGISVRDYFAAMALQGLVASSIAVNTDEIQRDEAACAQWAYRLADAMLATRTETRHD